jgi:hypothetical protein
LNVDAAASGFLRKVKNPTAMGMMMKMTDRHKSAKPNAAGMGWELVCPLTVVSKGVPIAPSTPNEHEMIAAHRHNSDVRVVMMIATVQLFMVSPFGGTVN